MGALFFTLNSTKNIVSAADFEIIPQATDSVGDAVTHI